MEMNNKKACGKCQEAALQLEQLTILQQKISMTCML